MSEKSYLHRIAETGCAVVKSASAEETEALGRVMGAAVRGPMVLAMTGDLGSGKTCFARGFARGLGVDASYPVTSPTYTIVNEYPGRLPLFHLDLYRLAEAEELEEIGYRDMLQEGGVILVEWPERAEAHELEVDFTLSIHEEDFDTRRLTFKRFHEKVDVPFLF